MTAPATLAPVVSVDSKIVGAVDRMKLNASGRDADMHRVRLVREGRFAEVWPDQFSEEYPTALVANFVDIAARDLASNLAELPSLQCAAGPQKTDADKRRSQKKNRIGQNYWLHADVEYQNKFGADQYITHAFLPVWVEPDVDAKLPYIHLEDPRGAYYELDRRGKCVRYARVYRQDIHELCAMFPEYEEQIRGDVYERSNGPDSVEVVRYIDDMNVTMYLPGRKGIIIGRYAHKMPYCPVHIAIRPGLDQEKPRGQFDDVLWVQLAASVMAALTIEAGHKAIQAPIAVPSDVTEINIGPDAVIVTDHPEKVQRIPLSVPQSVMALSQGLKEEMREGAGYPQTRMGNPGQANVTGRGIDALGGGFDSQIKLGQDVLGRMLRSVTAMAFEMDEIWWPNKAKKIDGTISGESFSVMYTPSKDIAGNYYCSVSYGFASGSNPQSALVTMLQLRGDELISRDTVRRNMPFDVDVDHEQEMVDIQAMEDALKQGIQAALQSAGQMIAQGQTSEAIQFFQAAAAIIQGRRNGEEISDLIVSTFTKTQQDQQAAAQAAAAQAPPGQDPNAPPGASPGPGGSPAPGQPLDGVGPTGLPPGVAAGQAGQAPGGRPSIQDMVAGFTGGGAPQMSDSIHRKMATG